MTTDRELTRTQQIAAIKTWRYLRCAMVIFVVSLGASIGYERWETDEQCFQPSISAYYYTPVQGYFIGSLVAVGACLICLKGNTEVEDILLNLAGTFAVFVALVPIPDPGTCASVVRELVTRRDNVANNVFALLVAGALALLFLAYNAIRNLRRGDGTPPTRALVGYGVTVGAWVATVLVFWLDRPLFIRRAHYAAAILMFVCILLVVAINARSYKAARGKPTLRNRYTFIAILMLLSCLVIGIAALAGWDQWILGIETALIAWFAIFWATQTAELWDVGLR